MAKTTPIASVTPLIGSSGVRSLRPRSASAASFFVFSTGWTMSDAYPAGWLATHVEFDVLVLGGGTAGCVLAARLSEEPERTVCLVEAGPDYGPYADGRWPDDLLDGRRLALHSHCWE